MFPRKKQAKDDGGAANHEAVKIGNMERTLDPLSMVKPKITANFPVAVVREGADDLTLRREEGMLRTFSNSTNVGGSRWPLLVDEDEHAICQERNGRTCVTSK